MPPLVGRFDRGVVTWPALRGLNLSQQGLARETGLPPAALLQAIGEPESKGLTEKGSGAAVEIPVRARHTAAACCIGVDLGGTKVAAAIADRRGNILAELAEATDPRGGMHVLEQIHALAGRLLATGKIEPGLIGSVTIGMPGVIHPRTGAVSLGHNIEGLSDLNVPAALAALFGGAVEVENDVNLAVLGEIWKGDAKGCRNVGFLSLGTGTGLGLVVNGNLVRGASGAAGEISYLPLGSNLNSALALKIGAFELEVGSAGIAGRYKAGGGAAATVRDIFALMETDDLAAAVVDHVAEKVALAIVTLQATLDLDKVILGGSIGLRPELVQRVQRAISRVFARPVDIAASALGSRAGLIGAVASATQRLNRERRDSGSDDDADFSAEHDLAGAAE